jgi:hypothetical protein
MIDNHLTKKLNQAFLGPSGFGGPQSVANCIESLQISQNC